VSLDVDDLAGETKAVRHSRKIIFQMAEVEKTEFGLEKRLVNPVAQDKNGQNYKRPHAGRWQETKWEISTQSSCHLSLMKSSPYLNSPMLPS
jgi:hypothetical protein